MIDTSCLRRKILDTLLNPESLKKSCSSKENKLGDVLKIERGGSPRPIKSYLTTSDDGMNWIKIGDTKPGSKYIEAVKEKIKPEGLKKSRFVREGDFLLSNSMSFGRPYILKVDGCIHDGWLVLKDRNSIFDKNFLYYYLSSPRLYAEFAIKAGGSTVENLNIDLVSSVDIIIPPLEDQKRIVAKIEELFAKIDEIDKAQKELKELAELAEKKVLDMAVRGELVEQDETDQSAEQFISNVKDKIDVAVSKKVIRKKAVTPMLDADIPYDIPGNWCWEKIGALFAINPKNVGISDNDIVGFVPMTLMDAGISNHHEYEEKPWKEIKKGFTALQNGDLAIAKITPCFQNRKSGVIQNLPNGVGGGTTEFHVLRDISHTFDMRYALALVQTQEFIDYGVSHFSGAVGQQRVSKEALADYPFPVPPFEEQQRIGEKIEEYLSLIKTMI